MSHQIVRERKKNSLTSPVLKAIGANTERQFKSKGGKKLHRGEKKAGKTRPEPNDGAVELTMQQLQDLLLQDNNQGEDEEKMTVQPYVSDHVFICFVS